MEGRVNETRQKGIRSGNDGWTARDETENEKDGPEITGEERETKWKNGKERAANERAKSEQWELLC